MPPVLRDPGPRRRLWVASGLILMAGWAGWSVVQHQRSRSQPPVPAGADDPAFDRIYFRDVEQSSFEGGRKRWSFSAAEIVHRKRKLGPLTINPVKEIEMTGVRIEVDGSDDDIPGQGGADARLDLSLRWILEKVLASKNLGFVSRITIRRLDLALLRNGKPMLAVNAGGAAIGTGSGGVRFEDGVTVTGRAGERLEAAGMEWNPDGRRLWVKRGFRFDNGGGRHEGQGGTFCIDPDGTLRGE